MNGHGLRVAQRVVPRPGHFLQAVFKPLTANVAVVLSTISKPNNILDSATSDGQAIVKVPHAFGAGCGFGVSTIKLMHKQYYSSYFEIVSKGRKNPPPESPQRGRGYSTAGGRELEARNYSGCFCCLRQEGAAIEGAAEIFEDWEAVFAEG